MRTFCFILAAINFFFFYNDISTGDIKGMTWASGLVALGCFTLAWYWRGDTQKR